MAGNLTQSKRKSNRGKRYRPMAEINVTPFVDVMLVLLIIFMVTAPLMTVGVPVDLPKTKAAQLNDVEEPLVISVKEDGSIYIQESPIEPDNIAPRLIALSQNNLNLRIFIRADTRLNYGVVLGLMGNITNAGFSRVALLAQMPE